MGQAHQLANFINGEANCRARRMNRNLAIASLPVLALASLTTPGALHSDL
jgi:hypothetical protein